MKKTSCTDKLFTEFTWSSLIRLKYLKDGLQTKHSAKPTTTSCGTVPHVSIYENQITSIYVNICNYLVDERLWLIVATGIVKHEDEIGDHVFDTVILVGHHPCKHLLHVDWLLYDLIVVWVILTDVKKLTCNNLKLKKSNRWYRARMYKTVVEVAFNLFSLQNMQAVKVHNNTGQSENSIRTMWIPPRNIAKCNTLEHNSLEHKTTECNTTKCNILS